MVHLIISHGTLVCHDILGSVTYNSHHGGNKGCPPPAVVSTTIRLATYSVHLRCLSTQTLFSPMPYMRNDDVDTLMK